MSEDGEIIVPSGTRYVAVQDIPQWIALALYPEFSGEMTVDFIRKIEASALGVSNRTSELAPEDWERLSAIWGNLPPFQSGMSESTWRPYVEAFDAAAHGLSWRMVPFTRNGPLGTAMLRASAEERHSEHLQQTIREGRLTTYDHARVANRPEHGGFPDAQVRIDDFKTYAEGFHLNVRVIPTAQTTEGPALPTAKPLSRQRHQEDEILRVIAELGYQATSLPRPAPGDEGPKAAVRARLKFMPGVFDKAWERLRKTREIQDAK